MKNIVRFIALVFVGITSFVITSCSTSNEGKYEIPNYTVLEKHGDIEVRKYPAILVAEVTTKGNRSDAANEAFFILADYIFGENIPGEKMEMTAPVTQQSEIKGEKMEMTAPVTQSSTNDNEWVVRFMMPAKYTLKNLPKPKDTRIRIIKTNPEKVATIRFPGRWSEENLLKHQAILEKFMIERKLKRLNDAPTYAFYDDPFTFPWDRRTEVHFRVK